jgi:hypothetical protein
MKMKVISITPVDGEETEIGLQFSAESMMEQEELGRTLGLDTAAKVAVAPLKNFFAHTGAVAQGVPKPKAEETGE